AYFATLDTFTDVEVPERGSAEGATLLGFLTHLVADVGAITLGAKLVERGEHAHEHLAFGRVVDVLRRGYEADLALLKVQQGNCALGPVPVHARELVDDDVVDITLVLDALHHRLKDG